MSARLLTVHRATVSINGERFKYLSPAMAKALTPNSAVPPTSPGAGPADQRTRSAGQPSKGAR